METDYGIKFLPGSRWDGFPPAALQLPGSFTLAALQLNCDFAIGDCRQFLANDSAAGPAFSPAASFDARYRPTGASAHTLVTELFTLGGRKRKTEWNRRDSESLGAHAVGGWSEQELPCHIPLRCCRVTRPLGSL